MIKLKEIDNIFFKFVKEHCLEILFFIITVISLKARINFLNYESEDFTTFLLDWFNELKSNGGIFGLKYEIGNYNVPYLLILAVLTYIPENPLLLIKIVSIFFDYVIAIVAMMIIYELLKKVKISIYMQY